MEELMRYGFEHRYILIGISTALLGASARISYEKEAIVIKKRRAFGFFTAAVFVGYVSFEMLRYWNLERATGFVCAIAGLISIDILRILIEDLPNMLKKRLGKEINGNKNDHGESPEL